MNSDLEAAGCSADLRVVLQAARASEAELELESVQKARTELQAQLREHQENSRDLRAALAAREIDSLGDTN